MNFLKPTEPPAVSIITLPSVHHIITASSFGDDLLIEAYLPAFRALPPSQTRSRRIGSNDHFREWFFNHNCDGCIYNVDDTYEPETDEDGFNVITRRHSPCEIRRSGLSHVLFDSRQAYCDDDHDLDMDTNADYQEYLDEEEEAEAAALSSDNTPGPIHPPIVVGVRHHRPSNRITEVNIFYSTITEIDKNFYASPRDRAQNTYSGGGVCWGNNDDEVNDLAGFCNLYRKSAFNYDLTTPGHERHCLLTHKYFLRAMRMTTEADRNQKLVTSPIVSSPQDKAAALLTYGRNSIAEAQLKASGFPTELGVIPLYQRIVNDVVGWVTPAHPDYGHRWFVATPPNSFAPVLVGQLHD